MKSFNRKYVVLALLLVSFCSPMFAQKAYESQRDNWLQIAEAAKPELRHTRCLPVAMVEAKQDASAFQGWKYVPTDASVENVWNTVLKPGMSFTFDFGRHMVGYLSFSVKTLSRCQDAPLRFRFFVGELPAEMNTPLEPWGAWLSRAWMQDEVVTVLQVDQSVTLPRRFAGRYVRVEVLAASQDFDCALSSLSFDAVSSAGESQTTLSPSAPEEIRNIYNVGLTTLRECMQTVYEDGPKRDQRLWSGDLYLQSLANRYSFRNFALTKRCLYLFAALSADDGVVISNIFEKPQPHAQIGSYCLTYCLLWNSALLEYLIDTGDKQTAEDLWPVAKRQMEDALSYVGTDWIFNPDARNNNVWLFFDWRDGLDVHTPMQGATIFALEQTYELARMIGKDKEVSKYPSMAQKMRKAALAKMYDKSSGVMVSGAQKQVSVLSQTWAIKSGILTGAKAQKAIRQALASGQTVMPGTPYATHYLVDAMLLCGMNREAYDYLVSYWGDMVNKGADTFWEAYDPKDDFISPYSFSPVNSACHAWSCTPVYFIQKYPEIFQQRVSVSEE